MTDHDKYRTPEEKAKWRSRDPIEKLKEYIINNSIASDADLKKIEEQVQQNVNKAAEFALESPMPPPDALYEDVYSD